MNIEETGKLLARVAAVDNRRDDDAATLGWYEILSDISLDDAMAGLKSHRMNFPGVWVEPGHVREQVKLIRQARLRTIGNGYHGPEGLEPHEELAWTRRFNRAIADGLEIEAARTEAGQTLLQIGGGRG